MSISNDIREFTLESERLELKHERSRILHRLERLQKEVGALEMRHQWVLERMNEIDSQRRPELDPGDAEPTGGNRSAGTAPSGLSLSTGGVGAGACPHCREQAGTGATRECPVCGGTGTVPAR